MLWLKDTDVDTLFFYLLVRLIEFFSSKCINISFSRQSVHKAIVGWVCAKVQPLDSLPFCPKMFFVGFLRGGSEKMVFGHYKVKAAKIMPLKTWVCA